MPSTPISSEADRIALNNMFKAIADYGRKVRLRRLAECSEPVCKEIHEDQLKEKPEEKELAN